VRLVASAAFVLTVATALGGCGSSEEPTWAGPPAPGDYGLVSTREFAAYQNEVDEPWERSAAMAAAEFLRLDQRTAVRTTIDVSASGEGGGPQSGVVTLEGLMDDSVRSERWTLGFEEGPEGTYVLSAATREQRCYPGRGHQDYSAEPCV
jgi:hypothetical protein